MLNTYKIRSHQEHELLLYHALLIRLNLTSQKFYIYKIVFKTKRFTKVQHTIIEFRGLFLES